MKALLTKEDIKRLALENGFKLKQQPSGEMELNPYVYDFARALIDAAKNSEKEDHESDDGLHDNKSCDSAMIGQLQVKLTEANERIELISTVSKIRQNEIGQLKLELSETKGLLDRCQGAVNDLQVTQACRDRDLVRIGSDFTKASERLKSLEQENKENLSIIESIANGLSENPISLCKGVMHGRNKQLSQIALENKIEGVKLVLQNERFALDDRPFDFGIRVESVESMLRNLEVELNAMSSSE